MCVKRPGGLLEQWQPEHVPVFQDLQFQSGKDTNDCSDLCLKGIVESSSQV